MRILIIEDNICFAKPLKKKLEEKTYAVDLVDNAPKGSYLARVNDYDLILLDNSLANNDEHNVCCEIRNAGKQTPIIIISETFTLQEKIHLLKIGADDYITKPFSFDELMAVIQAILRRPPIKHGQILTINNVRLDCYLQQVIKNDKRIYLTRKEFALLEYLLRNKGIILSRGMIMEHVWNEETDPFSNTIESHILSLRKKIDSGKKRLIHNIPGRGYKIDLIR